MNSYLDIIREIYPSQIYLTPRQIARVLHGPGRDTRTRAQDVRRQLDDGSLIPGLLKRAGQKRWLVSIVDLARALNAEVERQPKWGPPVVTARGRGRFKNPGPRLVR